MIGTKIEINVILMKHVHSCKNKIEVLKDEFASFRRTGKNTHNFVLRAIKFARWNCLSFLNEKKQNQLSIFNGFR